MPATLKELPTIKGFGPGTVSSEAKALADDPFNVTKVEEATRTIQRAELPGQKKK
jgi:hypothetical protein